jgi:hypothetical protein
VLGVSTDITERKRIEVALRPKARAWLARSASTNREDYEARFPAKAEALGSSPFFRKKRDDLAFCL